MPKDQVAAVIDETNMQNVSDDEQAVDDMDALIPDARDGKAEPGRGFFLLGLMLGSAVGAALALLYTPRSVEKARHEFADRAGDLDEPASDDVPDGGADTADAPL